MFQFSCLVYNVPEHLAVAAEVKAGLATFKPSMLHPSSAHLVSCTLLTSSCYSVRVVLQPHPSDTETEPDSGGADLHSTDQPLFSSNAGKFVV